jgi:replicative DNA helicase
VSPEVSVTTDRREIRREPPIVAGRVPPHDLDAEAAVLSSVLLKRDALDEVADLLKPEQFYSEANGRIYGAAIELASEGTPVDLVTVASLLRDREQLGSIGGPGYLVQIVDATPAVAHVAAHAKTVAEKSQVRRVIAECQLIGAEGYGDVGAVPEWLDEVERRVLGTTEATSSDDEPEMAGAVLARIFTELRDEAAGRAPRVLRIATGLPDLDGLLTGGGLAIGEVTATGAYWGVGKTSLGLEVGVRVAIASPKPPPADVDGVTVEGLPTGVAFFSVEMEKAPLVKRALMQLSRIDGSKPIPKWTQDEWKAATTASIDFSRAPFFIDDRSEQTPVTIRTRLRRMKADAKRRGFEIRLVIVDYLQLVSGRAHVGSRASREEEVAYLARSMKLLARTERVHVIVIAQLNDDANKRKDARPSSRDFRESKAIPMNADNCLLIHNPFARERALAHRDGHAAPKAPEAEVVEIILDKQRNGRTGTVRALFQPASTSFVSYDGRHYESDGDE